MRHFKIVLAVCLACWLGLAAGCSDDPKTGGDDKANADKARAVEFAMKYAPPGAIGVVHVDLKTVAGDILAELRKHKEQMKGISDAELDQVAATVARIDSVDMFFTKGPAGPKIVTVFRTPLAPADMTLLRKLASEPITLVKADNGRYDYIKGGMRAIFGAEADDLDSGVMLMGPLDMLTAEFVATLGRGDNATLLALLGEVDTSRPLWAVAGLEFVPDGAAPAKILASLDPRGPGRGSGTIAFKSERRAELAAEGIAGDEMPFAGLFSVQRDGTTVTIQLKSSGPLIPRAVASIFKVRRMAREAVSAANLNMLSKTIVMYAAEHDERMPPDLKALAPYLDGMRDVLRSPLSKGKLPASESDYVYIPLGRMTDIRGPHETIVLYERPENHDGKGTIAAFADGHVERVDMERFKELLKAAQALSAKRAKPN